MIKLVNPENYNFTLYSLPMLISGMAIACLGFFVLSRERISRIGASFFLMCMSVSFYQVCAALNNASLDLNLALFWSKLGNLGAIFIPLSVLVLTTELFELTQRYRSVIAASIIATILFTLGLFFTDLHIRRIDHFFWGNYGMYGPLGFTFIGYFICIMVLSMRLYWRAYRHSTTDRQKKRYRGLLTAFIGGYVGSVDFLPTFGIPIYPFGYMSVGFFIAVSTYVILRYRLVDITPELAAEQVLETMQGAVIVTDLDHRIKVINDVAIGMIGSSKADVLGKDLMSMLPIPRDFSAALITGRKPLSREMVWSAMGQQYDVNVTASLLFDRRDREPEGIVYVAADITHLRHAENALRGSEERFRSLFEKVHVVALVIDPTDGSIIDANPAASTFYGWSHDELLARKITDINTLSRDAVRMEMEAAKSEQRTYFVFKHRRADGALRDVEVYSGPIQSGDRTVLYSIIHDITERKKAEDSLVSSLDSYRGLFNGVGEAIYVMDRQGRFMDVNAAAERMYGLSREQLIGKTPGDMSAPGRNDLNATMAALAGAFAGEPQRFEFWGQRASGEAFPKEVRLMRGTYFGQEVVIASADDITERKKMEAEREQFYKFFQTSADIMVIADPNGAFLKVNPACTEMLGYSADELVAKPFVDFIHPDDKQPTLDEMARQQKIGFSLNFENRYQCKDGTYKLLSWQATFSKEEGITFATARDITKRRETERALQESKKLFELLFSTSPDAALISRLEDGIITNINDVFTKLFGYSREELVGNTTLNLRLWGPEDRQRFVAELLENRFCRGLEFQFRKKDGSMFFGSLSANVTEIERVPHIISNTRDISERKLAEAQLKDAHGRLLTVLNGLDAIVYVADMNTYELLFINNYIKDIFGDISGKQCWKTLQTSQSGPCDFCTNNKLIDGSGQPAGIYKWEFQNTANGRWYDIRDRALHWVDGRIVRMEIATDITERKQGEEKIHQLATEQRTILNTMAVGVLYVKDRRLVWTNPGFDRIFGYAAKEAWGFDARRLYVHDEDYVRVGKEGYAKISSGGIYTTECMGIKKDGRQFWLRLTGSAVNPEDMAAGSIWMLEDIHEKKEAEKALIVKTRQLEDLTRNLEQKVQEEIAIRTKSEQMLVQQSKMAAMGEMLGAIAHQWRQPLNALGLIIQNIRDAQAHGELDRAYIEHTVQKAMSQVQHMSHTIDDFRRFFQPDKEKTVFDAMQATGDVLSMFSAQLAANDISFQLTCHIHGKTFTKVEDIIACPDMTLMGFQNEFEHVIMNLLNNAREAIIDYRESNSIRRDGSGLIIFKFSNEAGTIIIEVIDSGCGIPETILDRIFEPYFSTKDPSKGTGLGLYMSKVIIEDHMHGRLSARNGDQGAVFIIELPQTEERKQA